MSAMQQQQQQPVLHPKRPAGLAILLGAGPTTGAGIARILASPLHGNLAVALLSRSASPALADSLRTSSGGGILHSFATDTSEASLARAFEEIKQHEAFRGLRLKLAIFNIKHAHKVAFEEESAERFIESLGVYVGGAMVFAQLSLKWMLGHDGGEKSGRSTVLEKKGTLIFTGTLGSLRTNAGYAAYGAGRSGVRMLAQSLAREYSARGIHVVHAIANGGITDEGDGKDREKVESGERIKAESVGKLYLGLMEMGVDLWVHELDMRPAAEKF